MIVQVNYRNKVPARILRLVRWLVVRSRSWNSDIFDDVDGRTEYVTFQLSFSKIRISIDKSNDGYSEFQLEKTSNEH